MQMKKRKVDIVEIRGVNVIQCSTCSFLPDGHIIVGLQSKPKCKKNQEMEEHQAHITEMGGDFLYRFDCKYYLNS